MGVEGVRLPTSSQKSQMRQEVALRLEQFARSSPELFRQLGGAPAMSEEAFLKVGQGHFGRFSQSFSIPQDVNVADIEAAYEDGKVRVVLPKKKVAFREMVSLPESYCRQRIVNPFHRMDMPF